MKQNYFVYKGTKYISGTKIDTAWWDDESSANDICTFLDYDTGSKKYRCRLGAREIFYSQDQWDTVVKGVISSQAVSSNKLGSSKANNPENNENTGTILLIIFGVILLLLVAVFPKLLILFGLAVIFLIFKVISSSIDDVNEANGTNAKKREKEAEEIAKEREFATQTSSATAAWDKKYFPHPCSHCGHYKVRYANYDDKRFSIAFWGGASDKMGKRYKCEYCGQMW